MPNFPSEENSTFGNVIPSQIDAFNDVAREIKKIRFENEESMAGAAAAVDVPSEKVSIKIQMKRKTPKCRRGPKKKIRSNVVSVVKFSPTLQIGEGTKRIEFAA